jgi:hypothetical protein
MTNPNDHFPLQSALLGKQNPDQFYALNLPVNSVCPYLLWLLNNTQRNAPNPVGGKSRWLEIHPKFKRELLWERTQER